MDQYSYPAPWTWGIGYTDAGGQYHSLTAANGVNLIDGEYSHVADSQKPLLAQAHAIPSLCEALEHANAAFDLLHPDNHAHLSDVEFVRALNGAADSVRTALALLDEKEKVE